jgi:hypothetical protein
MHKSHQIETWHFQKPSGSIERLLYKRNNLTQTQVSGTDFRVHLSTKILPPGRTIKYEVAPKDASE